LAYSYNRVLQPFNSSGLTGFTINNSTYYDNFYNCYTNQMGNFQNLTSSIPQGVIDFISNVEGSLNCNGVCNQGLFFYFKQIYNGPPANNCLDGLKAIFKDKPMAIGILLLISFFITFLAHFTAYSFCCSCCQHKNVKDSW
jgi:hypothetical protein